MHSRGCNKLQQQQQQQQDNGVSSIECVIPNVLINRIVVNYDGRHILLRCDCVCVSSVCTYTLVSLVTVITNIEVYHAHIRKVHINKTHFDIDWRHTPMQSNVLRGSSPFKPCLCVCVCRFGPTLAKDTFLSFARPT